MAPIRPIGAKPQLGNVLVIGGCGFLGHHIVNQILDSWTAKISVIDLRTDRNRRPDSDGVAYFDGDITSLESLLTIFQKAKPDVVIHTASPLAIADASKKTKELYYKVNVQGTKTVIEACQKTGVKALVYTSSASVVSDNGATDLINADERWPVVPTPFQTEYYALTKAEAESFVLKANRVNGSKLLTTSLRPAGIFGEGDAQVTPSIYNVYKTGKTGFQLGNNTNLFDFTYVGNVAHAHLLAASALLQTYSLATAPLDHEKVDGEAFFITNDQPIYFWDFARGIWKAAGSPKGKEHVWVIPRDVGLFIGGVLEWIMWAVGRTPKLTTRLVNFSNMTRYYDCSKAKRRLGYKPLVGVWEGIQRAVKYIQDKEKTDLKTE